VGGAGVTISFEPLDGSKKLVMHIKEDQNDEENNHS